MKMCPKCGATMPNDATMCPACGAPMKSPKAHGIDTPRASSVPRSVATAILERQSSDP